MPRKPKSDAGDEGKGKRKPAKRAGSAPNAAALDAVHAEVVRLADAFCRAHLNEEYAELCRMLADNLRNAPRSPLLRGAAEGWAAGIVYTAGWVNFLTDPSQTPHLKTADFCRLIGVSQATVMNRSKEIRERFDLMRMDPRLTLTSKLDDNMFVWMIELSNGMIDDARRYPRSAQERLVAAGLIPYVHPAAVDDTGDEEGNDNVENENGKSNGHPG